ncbi:ABC transporter ATP-binding protein [Denitrobaculum tricleocarpae]|uniref:Spermidine/putrescine import ATP-binding protein PotA n=1 Tax=Denitrobaculum tricleocarpae TaxID=2591009 RepID=A0A545TYM1_9PROT|nr:ABC transporter ATP-binding protein [Denitrobaculum tricleocarpae]TQV82332.1 ABC transporter ATP-binding protein [Denitrobaculum tricleocarpae]
MAVSGQEARKKWEPWNDPQEKPHVQLVGVSKRFGEFTAVDNISLDIYKGEFFSLLGPSGCGKTTLLRMLAGFEQPSQGQILLEGSDMSGVPPYRRPVNMMFQSYALFPHMSVERNIAFGLKQDKIPNLEIAQRVEEVIELVELGAFAKRKPHQLSGGQRQRVALARALVKKPKMLLLDEPLGALDKKLRAQTQFELMNIQERLGITFVIVTHDQEEAMTVSTRIAVMDHGRIVQVATPTEIYEYPNSRYVAGFIGDVNIVEGRVAEVGDGHLTIASEDSGCSIRARHALDAPVGAAVWIALRPEKLVISMEAPADTRSNCMAGEVWDIGYLGNLSIYHVKLDSGAMITTAKTNRTRDTEQPITWEDRVYLTWTPDAGIVLGQ